MVGAVVEPGAGVATGAAAGCFPAPHPTRTVMVITDVHTTIGLRVVRSPLRRERRITIEGHASLAVPGLLGYVVLRVHEL